MILLEILFFCIIQTKRNVYYSFWSISDDFEARTKIICTDNQTGVSKSKGKRVKIVLLKIILKKLKYFNFSKVNNFIFNLN